MQEAPSIWRMVAEPGDGEEQRKFEIAVVGRVVTTDTLSALHPPSSPGHLPLGPLTALINEDDLKDMTARPAPHIPL